MNLDDFARMFPAKMDELTQYIEGDDIKQLMGDAAVNFYKQSFNNEGFTDKTLEKWPEVERRKPESSWYKKGADSGRKILSGGEKQLQDSLTFEYIPKGVKIKSPMIYASVHQFGEGASIFGKKAFTMKARPFIGRSAVMKDQIENEIEKELVKIISKK